MIFNSAASGQVKTRHRTGAQIGLDTHRTVIPAIHVTDFIIAREASENTGISKICQYNVVRPFDFHFDEH